MDLLLRICLPTVGLVSLGLVLVNRRILLRPRTRRERLVRGVMPFLILGFLINAASYCLRFYLDREYGALGLGVFGVLGCFGALVLCASFFFRWLEE